MAKTYDVIVIGAGVNGLTAAAYLAKAGRKVLVLESRAQPGGSATTDELTPGFRFDACTSDPGFLSPQLLRDLDLGKHGLALLMPDPALTALHDDGEPFVLSRDQKRSAAAIAKLSARDAKSWPAFTQRMAKLAGFLGLLYTSPPPRPIGGGMGELLTMANLGRKLRGLGKADMVELLRVLPMPVGELLDDEFESELLKATIAVSGVTALCQGVHSAGTTFKLLHDHTGGDVGAFRMRQRVRGGTGALAQALAFAAHASGADIRYGARVQHVRIAGEQANGVVLVGGEEVAAKQVVSSADPRSTLLDLVGPAHLDPELVRAVGNIRFRGVVARVHLALGELPKIPGLPADGEALRGVISIAPTLDYIEHAYDATKYGRVSDNPILEFTIPSVADPSVAPAGKHVMSVSMQYAPYKLRDDVWSDAKRAALGDAVVQMIAQYAPNVATLIEERTVLTPADLERQYAQPGGSIDHGELGLDQILFMRPLPGWSRYQTPIQGLYMGGAGSHPGRAIAGGSGRLAAQAILNDAKVKA